MGNSEENVSELEVDDVVNDVSEAEPSVEVDTAGANEVGLEAQLAQALAEAEKNKEAAMRAKAELENIKRRHEKELQNAHKFGLEKFTAELLTVRDSLEMGLAAADHNASDFTKMVEGMALTLKQLSTAMEKFGIVQVSPEGEKFNPDQHQAITMQESDAEPNTVIVVVQKGYLLNERLVRPAMVVVSKKPAQEQVSVDEQA